MPDENFDPAASGKDRKGPGCLAAVSLIVIIIVVFASCGGGDKHRGYELSDFNVELDSKSVCEDAVRNQLNAPSTAKFSHEKVSINAESKSTDVWKANVTGVVEAENQLGGRVSRAWACSATVDSHGQAKGDATLVE
ncbi:hypothetical protein FYJ43_04540 [Cutibacterium sp. WCA-380-WT-3A]|uniref:Uncharacterized protein n=1 Tax=Cutibacterium porci TaxID=2605781 RepID=A0A7K0J5W5_9ACTN|nr:hypothetical protein [Cutibacterium porci]MSS45326.1 hypothetical protein [Cutibacterium porci]